MITLTNSDESRKILEEDKLFRKDGGLNTAWLHCRANNYDFSKLEGDSIQEKLYLLYHNRVYCSVCGKPTPFKNWSYGYTTVCCAECNKIRSKNDLLKNAIPKVQTQEAKEKRKNTNIKKYGVENVFQTNETKNKIKETLIKNYNVTSPAKSKDILQKIKNTTISKYGVEYYTQTEEYKKRSKETKEEKILSIEQENNCTEIDKLINLYGQGWISLKLPKLQFGKYKFISNIYLDKIKEYYQNSIENINHAEIEIFNFCKELLPNTDIILHDRKEIAPLELDILIPAKKVAIEFNGVYWHSFKDKNYHLNKTKLCEEKGIRLLHIWEDLWINKKEIYKSIIKSALGIYDKKISARKCVCREIDNSTYKDFLIENHIQGAMNSTIRLGLFFNDELVQIAGWGKSRFKKGDYELHRMCSKLNTQVVGGFSKLIYHSNLDKFTSYVDRELYNGNGYRACGFSMKGYTSVGYFYKNNKKTEPRMNRISAQKHKLKEILKEYDDTLTEGENMNINGYFKLYNCGNIIVEWKKP